MAAKAKGPVAGWVKVVHAFECDEYGNCPRCGTDYSECPCPGPTMDGWEYRWVRKKGQQHATLWARPEQEE